MKLAPVPLATCCLLTASLFFALPRVARGDPTPLETQISRTTGFATARDGTRIYYEKNGSGPALVFVHGLGRNHAVWFYQVPAFAAHFTVITFSQRGFAPSTGRQDHFDGSVLVDDLLTVMDACGTPQASIVGQSMGGWVALGLALRAPERVRSLVLADTLAGISDTQIETQRQAVAPARTASQAGALLGQHPGLSPEFSAADPAHAYLYQMLSSFGAPDPGTISGQLAAARFDNQQLARMKTPTLFVVGSGDVRSPPAIVRQASTHIPGSQVVEIAAAGHSPYFEQPKNWNQAVATFLGRTLLH
jgi:pimeloyl-ACP methyl ester carboxylesterase